MKFTEQERDFLKQEFADLCHAAINSMITAGSFVRAIDRIEQIVSERLTIKPYHEHGNSVASDRTEPGESGQINAKWDEIERTFNNKPFAPIDSTESGQSADGGIAIMEILQPIHRHPFDAESGREMEIWYTHKDVWNAMTTYASQVCADKEREIEKWREAGYNNHKNTERLESEIDRLNESLTVMVRKNAELEKELEFKRLA